MHREVGAEPVVNGVTKGEHAGLPEQHVVGERKDDGDAHQAQHGQRRARAEDQRQQRPARCAPAIHSPKGARRPSRFVPPPSADALQDRIAHVSRFPNRPVGLKIKTRTSRT